MPDVVFDQCRVIDAAKGLVEDLGPDGTPRRKVAIVGFAPSSKHLAPFADLLWSIWGMNQLYRHIPRLTRWFEIHPHTGPRSYLADQAPGTDYLGWMRSCPVPLYMVTRREDIPNAIEYPIGRMVERFRLQDLRPDIGDVGYFHSSVDYMIALALAEGFEEIGVWGIDMSHDCLAGHTRVLTADLRWVRADKVNVGDELLGFDEETRRHTGDKGAAHFRQWHPTTVTAASRLERPSYHIVLEDGTEFVASANHKWLISDGRNNRWFLTEQLWTRGRKNSRPAELVRLTDVWDDDQSWDAGYLAGAFDGEGCLYQNPRSYAISYTQRDNEMLAQVRASMAALQFKFNVPAQKRRDGVLNGCAMYPLHGRRYDYLRFLGQVRPRRLLARFDPNKIGRVRKGEAVPVTKLEYMGMQPVIGLATTTKTFVAEGYASHNSEYQRQKPSASFWIGVAHALGVKVTIPVQSALLNNMGYRYGYDAEEDFQDIKLAESRGQALNERMGQLQAEMHQVTGMAQDNMHWLEYHKARSRGAVAGPATSTA